MHCAHLLQSPDGCIDLILSLPSFRNSVQLLFTVKIVRQYAMVYVLGTSTVIFSFLSGYVIIMAHLKDYLFTGVKPKCVQGRWLDTEVDTVYKAIVIREFFTNQKSVDICRANIPECIKERIIGRPICVACYDDIFVIQYITERSKFLRFLAELFRGMLFKWKGENKKSHQKRDLIVNLRP